MADTKTKITQFEKAQKNQEEDWEKKKQRAKFDSKLSKFQGVNQGTAQPSSHAASEVKNKAKYFTDIPGAEARLKEAQARKASFDQMKSGFERQSTMSEQESSKVSSSLEIFAPDLLKEEEEERKKAEDLKRKEEFKEKSKAFNN